MASLRSGFLSRQSVCSLPRFHFERHFSLSSCGTGIAALKNGVAGSSNSSSSSKIPSETRRNSTLGGGGQTSQTESNDIISAADMDSFSFTDSAEGGGLTDGGEGSGKLEGYIRPIPASPSYFTLQPLFRDNLLRLETLYRKYGHLPLVPPDQVERIAWRSLRDYQNSTGENIRAPMYNRCIALVKHLNKIRPALRPAGVVEMLDEFRREVNPFDNVPKPLPIDRFGRTVGVGRRKESSARAWVVEGTGEILVNGRSLSDMFGRVHDRESATWALQASNRMDKYNVWALVSGGGTTGQAEALTLAVAKGLLGHEPALKTILRRAGCISTDRRKVERKKPGHVKARKSPTWVKR